MRGPVSPRWLPSDGRIGELLQEGCSHNGTRQLHPDRHGEDVPALPQSRHTGFSHPQDQVQLDPVVPGAPARRSPTCRQQHGIHIHGLLSWEPERYGHGQMINVNA